MTKVFEDIKGGSVSITQFNGTKVVRKFIISEIEGNPRDIIFLGATAGGVPQPGELHPSIPFLIVESISTSVIGSNEIEVTVNYTSPTFAVDEEAKVQISISATVQSVQTNQFVAADGSKKLMVLKYEFPVDKDSEGTTTIKEIVPTATKEQALIVVTLSRLESSNPLEKSKRFVDKLNSGSFLGDGPKIWLCTSLGGPSSDAGETYLVSYVFTRKVVDWDVTLAFTDKETGQIPTDVEDQPDAKKEFQLQETADFGELEIEGFIL